MKEIQQIESLLQKLKNLYPLNLTKMKEIQQIESLLQKLKNLKKENNLSIQSELPELPFKIGEAFLIRTVTMYYTGRISDIIGKFLILDECAWIADTGRLMDAIKDGKFNEIEPMGNSIRVNSDAIVDAIPYQLKLPNSQK